MSGLAEVLVRLTPEQRRHFVRRLAEESAEASASRQRGPRTGSPDRIEPRRPGEPVPLSFAQQRLWFLEQLDPAAGAYNLSNCLEVRGELSLRVLREVVAELIRRHEALRTVFALPDGGAEPVQRVGEPWRPSLPVVELTALGVADQDRQGRRLAAADRSRPYDLARGPLLRLLLLRRGEAWHWLGLAMHHIVSDGWSFGLFTREVSVLYARFLEGRPSPLLPLSVQYGDFALWQRRALAGSRLAVLEQYWREALAGAPQMLELPVDRPRPAARSPFGGRRAMHLSPQLSSRVEVLGFWPGRRRSACSRCCSLSSRDSSPA
jgi:hypothetical protein